MDRLGYWLNEPIYTDSGVYCIQKRKYAIHSFCVNGLIPLLESHGYKFRFSDIELTRTLITLLFKLYEGHTVKPFMIDIDNQQEQYDTFCYTLDADSWDDFWRRWGTIQDFEEDRYAHKLVYELSGFVWTWLDFDHSPTIVKLYKQLEEMDAMEEGSKGREDPYLQETSKRDYQDRHW
jgi:hypothetical protein